MKYVEELTLVGFARKYMEHMHGNISEASEYAVFLHFVCDFSTDLRRNTAYLRANRWLCEPEAKIFRPIRKKGGVAV